MNISCLTREQRDFCVDMDPFQMMDWLEFPGTYALAATERNQTTGEDRPAGLMICSVNNQSLIIDWLCVSANYRMQGVGEQLLLKAFEMAKNAGFQTVKAYMNEEYGRDIVCHGQEQYFKERLFEQEQVLAGEWLTDLRTLETHPFFKQNHHKEKLSHKMLSFRKLPVAKIRESIACLVASQEAAVLYDMSNGIGNCYDPDLSFVLMDGERICGALVVQCIVQSTQYAGTDTGETVLYPVLFDSGSEQDVYVLLLEAMRTALTKYPPDTQVRVVLTNDRYERLCTYLMPRRRTANKLLIADVARLDNV